MAQQTALSVMGTPGMVRSFSAKTAAAVAEFVELTLWSRSTSLTLYGRSKDLTLDDRSTTLTLEDRA